jgi:hypothetical protein
MAGHIQKRATSVWCVQNGLIEYAEKMNCNAKRKSRTAGRTT